MSQKITIYPEDNLAEQIEALADKENRSISNMAIVLIKEALESRSERDSRASGRN